MGIKMLFNEVRKTTQDGAETIIQDIHCQCNGGSEHKGFLAFTWDRPQRKGLRLDLLTVPKKPFNSFDRIRQMGLRSLKAFHAGIL